MTKQRVAVLISGNGSNLQALIDACNDPNYPAEIAVVISNIENAFGLSRAKNVGIPAHVIDHKDYASRREFDDAIHQLLQHHLVDIVCLAGFMRLLTPEFVANWKDKLLNIHPSLLPSFKGINTHQEAIAAGVRFTGCTVHFVRSEMDVGPIIIQAVVPLLADDTPETLASRVLEQEHVCYPLALRWLAEGKLTIKDEKITVKGGMSMKAALVNPTL